MSQTTSCSGPNSKQISKHNHQVRGRSFASKTPEEKEAIRKKCAEAGRLGGIKGAVYGKLGGAPKRSREDEKEETAKFRKASRQARKEYCPERVHPKWASKYRMLQIMLQYREEKGIEKNADMKIEEYQDIMRLHFKKGKARDLERIWKMREKIEKKATDPDAPGKSGSFLSKGQHSSTKKLKSKRAVHVDNLEVALGRKTQLGPVHDQVKNWFEARRSAGTEVRRYDVLIQFLHCCDVRFEI